MMHDPTPKPISDETLMRFADGDLSPDEESFVGAEIARNPDLMKRLGAFRFTREELPGVYAPVLEVPRQLMEKFLGTAAGPARLLNGENQRLAEISIPKRVNLRRQFMALAAISTLMLIGAAGWFLRDSLRPDYSGRVAPASLQHALEEAPSRGSATLAGDMSIRLNSTFVSLQGRWCREYSILQGTRTRASALACRGADGIWRVEIDEDLADPSPQSTNSKAYVPAGKGRAQPKGKTESVAEYRDRIMGADVSLKDEQRLIKEHWNRKP